MNYIAWSCETDTANTYSKSYNYPFSIDYVNFIGEEIAKKKVKQFLYGKFYEYKVKHIFEKPVVLVFTVFGEDEIVMDKTENS